MKTLKQLIESKKRTIAAVSPLESVYKALEVMAIHNVGALLVFEGERLVGVFSERDYARKIILQDKSSRETKVGEIMTDKVICATPGHTIEEAMAIMTEKRIRHLPVLDDEQNVIGIVSIGDVVKETISQMQFTISQLESYIAG